MTEVLLIVTLVAASWLAYQVGHMRGKVHGYAVCVASMDDDVPSRSYRR